MSQSFARDGAHFIAYALNRFVAMIADDAGVQGVERSLAILS